MSNYQQVCSLDALAQLTACSYTCSSPSNRALGGISSENCNSREINIARIFSAQWRIPTIDIVLRNVRCDFSNKLFTHLIKRRRLGWEETGSMDPARWEKLIFRFRFWVRVEIQKNFSSLNAREERRKRGSESELGNQWFPICGNYWTNAASS